MTKSCRALDRLAALAAGICQDASIRLELGEAWAFDAVRRVIIVDRDHLHTRGEEFCAGVLSHEVGHFFVTRYHFFSLPAFPSRCALLDLLNSCEDPRVEEAMRRLYPGTATWLRATQHDRETTMPRALPEFARFCLECARGTDNGGRGVPPRVAQALAATTAARQEFVGTLPPSSMDPRDLGSDLAERYRVEVEPRLAGEVAAPPASPWERAVRLSSLEALRIVETRIVPAALGLWQKDVERLAAHLCAGRGRVAHAAAALKADNLRVLAVTAARALGEPEVDPAMPTHHPTLRLAERILDRLYEARRRPPHCPRGASAAEEAAAALRVEREKRTSSVSALARSRRSPETTTYEAALEQVADQVGRLARHLEEALRPRRRLRARAGYPSGSRVELRSAMQFEADPRRHGEIWKRSTVPDRRDTAVMLLVNLSGSMRGEKIHAALCGTVLLAETLHRLGVDFAVLGFQDELIPLREFGAPFDDEARRAIGGMPGEVSGTRTGRTARNQPSFNDDGPCLAEAARRLLDRPAYARVLVVISDGLPEGRHSTEADLHRAVAEIAERKPAIDLVGIGLGPNTQYVRPCYPDSRADVPVDRLADEIGMLLRRKLLGETGAE